MSPLPNMIPQPRSQKPIDVAANTIKFFERMLTAFFARQKPDSTHAKPRFMKNTKNAVIMTQLVSAMIFKSAAVGPAGAAAVSGGVPGDVAGSCAIASDPRNRVVQNTNAHSPIRLRNMRAVPLRDKMCEFDAPARQRKRYANHHNRCRADSDVTRM